MHCRLLVNRYVTAVLFRIPDTAECAALQLKAEKDGTVDSLHPVATHSVKGQTLHKQEILNGRKLVIFLKLFSKLKLWGDGWYKVRC